MRNVHLQRFILYVGRDVLKLFIVHPLCNAQKLRKEPRERYQNLSEEEKDKK